MKQMHFVNLDANETTFFLRQLTSIKARTYDVLYPEYKALSLIPVSNEAGAGADTILYRQFDTFGMMKLISSYADDLPRADVAGKEFSVIVKSIGGAYGYNIQEIKAAQFVGGKPLDARRAEAVRRAYEQGINYYAWLADGSEAFGGLYGIFFNPNVTKGTPITGNWATATADQIIADIGKAFGAIFALTKGVEYPDTVLMPPAQWTKISTTPRSTISDTTILKFLESAYPGVTFSWLNEATGVVNTLGNRPSGASSAVDCLLLYKRSPEKLTLEIPLPFEQLAPQERNLEYVVNAYGRIGGVLMYYPLACYIMEGI